VRVTKRRKANNALMVKGKSYTLAEAVDFLKKAAPVKFDASVDLQIKLGADPNASTQGVRGTTLLPHGTGRSVRVVVLTKDETGKAAEAAGADFVGGLDLINKIAGGWTDFDVVVASPSIMREVGKLGKVLGPKGLMPSPKAGTVTENVAEAVKELKKGRIEFKMDKQANLHCSIGKLSFDTAKLKENGQALLSALLKARPQEVKGNFIVSVCLSSTMGPGLRLAENEYREREAE